MALTDTVRDTRTDTDLSELADLAMPCDVRIGNRWGRPKRCDQPAAWIVRARCGGCDKPVTYLSCDRHEQLRRASTSAAPDGMQVTFRCPSCGWCGLAMCTVEPL